MNCSDPLCTMKWYSLYASNGDYIGSQHAYTKKDAKIQCEEIQDRIVKYVEIES